MDSHMTIAITGATGALGGLVATKLAGNGVPQRLIVRDPARAPQIEGSTVAVASYGDQQAALEALAGIDALFMVSAKESVDRLEEHRIFIEAARDAGVRHVVYTSFAGAAPDATFTFARDHHATEVFLAESGMDVTLLRDNFYMDIVGYLPGPDGVIRGPAGTGAAAFVARADVADAIVSILENPAAHRGRSYEMTGVEALGLARVAELLTVAAGKTVSYYAETVEEAYQSRAVFNGAQWEVDAWVSTYTAIASGEMSHVSGDVELLTGRRPVTLSEFLQAK
jgi:NAD(P)H dehydrogenase (quinone)